MRSSTSSASENQLIDLVNDTEVLEEALTHSRTPAGKTILGAIVASASGNGKGPAFVATNYAQGATTHANTKAAWATGIQKQLENSGWREEFMKAGGATGTRVHNVQRFANELAKIAFLGCQSLHAILKSKANLNGMLYYHF